MYWEIVRLIRSVSFHKNQVREVEREGEGGWGSVWLKESESVPNPKVAVSGTRLFANIFNIN